MASSDTASSSPDRWDQPDPRVQWALDLLDWQGAEPTSLVSYYGVPAFTALAGAAIWPMTNKWSRRPLRAGIHYTAMNAALGVAVGLYLRQWRRLSAEKDLALTRHYIMSHPDRFPEPERKKLGDRCVLYDWMPNR